MHKIILVILVLVLQPTLTYAEEKNITMKIEQEIAALNQEQQDDIKDWIDIGKDILAHYGIDKNLSVFENLDVVYEKWVKDIQEKPSEDSIILGLGAIFGDRLLHHHGTSWKMITDTHGTDFAVILKTGHQIYPMDFVAKRVYGDEKEIGFFSGMEKVVKNGFK